MYMRKGVLMALMSIMASVGTTEAVSSRAKSEFAASMNKAVRNKRVSEQKGRKDRLRRTLLSKALPVTPDAKQKMHTLRKLEDGQEEEEEEEEEEEDVDYGDFNFDASNFSVKYSGCAVISQLNGLGAEDGGEDEENGNIYSTKKFVTFRMCPSDTCSDSSFYGCKSNYGEYMILMEDYLDAFVEYKEKVFEYYCDYCEQCLYFEKYFYGSRNLEDAEAAGDDIDMDDAEVAAMQSDDDNHACKYYNECVNYLDVCDPDANEDDQNQDDGDDYYQEFEYEELFECTEVNNGDDDSSALWVGPHCGSDHMTITIGVFSDEYCTQYVGDDVDVVKLTKMKIDQDTLSEYFDESCIACRESDLPYNVAQEDAEDEDDINAICETLYESSAKCQQNLQDEDGYTGNLATSSQEENVCNYIYNVVTGQYDETGFLDMNVLKNENDNRNIVRKYYDSMQGEASLPQIFGLMAGAVGCLVMSIWASSLKRSFGKHSQPSLIFNDKAELNHGGYNSPEPVVKPSDVTTSPVPEWSNLSTPPASSTDEGTPFEADIAKATTTPAIV